MLTRTEGIVLKTQEYTEADLIVTYLTLDKGIIKTFAKSPRKTKSRFGSSLEPLTHAKIGLWGKEQSMPRITQSDIIKSYQNLRDDFFDFANIARLAEIIISLTPEGISNRKLFLFFLNIMDLFQTFENGQKDPLYIIAQIRLLALLGYAPRLKGCGKCGTRCLDFYPDSGTILCKKCVTVPYTKKEDAVKISNKTVLFYSHGIGWPIQTSKRLKPSKETISEISLLLEKHLNHLLDKKLQTSEFLSKV